MIEADIQELPFEGDDFEGEEPAAMLGLSDASDELRVLSPVRYSFHLQLSGDELIARGRIAVDVEFVCARCAVSFRAAIEEPSFIGVRNLEEEKERFVDLTPDIRESILLAFPSHPVCGSECKGLCPRCGVNWNNESCSCKPPADERWSGLDRLKTQS